jgi:hypothetical protein|tara:strand:- start:166 stop:1140 length:975 start_codon:yes stop_codon:yes gene_type:complete
MKCKFYEGYSVYKNKKDPVFVTPHSGPAFEVTTSRDDHSETVASLCWQKMKGTFVVANMSRKRVWGVDFNRDIPPKDMALSMYPRFMEGESSKELMEYRKKYGWVAADEKDYDIRAKIFNNFWDEVNKGSVIIIIHRAFPRIKALPSIMDFTTFDNKGIDKKFLSEILDELNKKYFDFFKNIEKEFKNVIRLEQERVVSNIQRIYGKFDLENIDVEFKSNLNKDIERIKEYATKDVIENMENKFTPDNFLKGVDSALEHSGIPELTIEKVFFGHLAGGPKRKLKPFEEKTIIQVEPSIFLNFWYPNKTAEIINEVIQKIKEQSK